MTGRPSRPPINHGSGTPGSLDTLAPDGGFLRSAILAFICVARILLLFLHGRSRPFFATALAAV